MTEPSPTPPAPPKKRYASQRSKSYAESIKHDPANAAFIDALRSWLGLAPIPKVTE